MAEDLLKKYTVDVDSINTLSAKGQTPAFSQGDVKTAILVINVTENGTAIDLTDLKVKVAFKKVDGKSVYQDETTGVTILDAASGKIQIELSTQALAAKGNVRGQISVTNEAGGLVAETTEFTFLVRESIVNNSIISTDDLPIVEQTIAAAQLLKDIDIENLVNMDTRLTEVSSQMAQSEAENQLDFVDVVRRANARPTTLYTKIQGNKSFEVCIPFKGQKSQQWYVEKDTNDDFIKLSGGWISEYGLSSSTIGTKGYDSITGVWTTGTTNEYTKEVGATFTTKFTGNGIKFRHLEDNRGGVWRFVVDGKPEWTKDYSTYGTSGATKTTMLFEFLPDGEHTIVGTFMGDDPLNPPSSGAGTSRGWVYSPAWELFVTKYSFIKEIEVFKMTSNKEFALAVTPVGASTAQWIPEHNNIGTAFAIEQKVYFDNKLQTDWTPQNNYYQFNSVQVVQRMYGKHPDNVNNLIEFITIHTFNADGVFTKTKINVLENVLINNGYAMMAPINFAFTDKMVTGLDNDYAIAKSDYSTTDLLEGDKAISFLFIGNSTYPNYVGAISASQPKKTFRIGEIGKRNPMTFIEFRSTSLSKLYPQVFQNYQATAGETFEFSGYYTIGEIPMADALYG